VSTWAITRAAGKPEAQTTQTQWHPTLPVPLLITEPGRTTAYTYDALGNALTQTVTDTGPTAGQTPPRTSAWTYSAQGLVASQSDPLGRVSNYAYDAAGNLTRLTNALGHVTAWQYDGAGRVTRETAPNGRVTAWAYDVRGRVTQINRGGEVTTLAYAPSGQVARATLPTGQVVDYTYDAAQRLIGAQDNRGARITYTLDAMGNRVGEQVADATQANAIVWATSRVVNSLNRVSAITNGLNASTQFGFDANGEATRSTDPLAQQTRLTLDALRRPTATTFADGAVAQQAYNALNELTQVTDPKGVATAYTRNAFGEVLAEASPDAGTTLYQRDNAGRITQMTDARGVQTVYTYDAADRVTRVSYPNAQAVLGSAQADTAFSYDAAGGLMGGGGASQVGLLSGFADASGATTYVRDLLGRISEQTTLVNDNPASPSSLKVRYTYGPGGLISQISYPSGLQVFYRRNAQGRVTSIDTQRPGSLLRPQPPQPFIQDIRYDALGQVLGWNWVFARQSAATPGAPSLSVVISAARSFDAAGRMTANELASYQYDAAGRVAGLAQQLWALRSVTGPDGTTTQGFFTPITWQVGYDQRNRITSFARLQAATSFTYDANGNRLGQVQANTSDIDLDGDFDGFDSTRRVQRSWRIDAASNRLLGFSQTASTTRDVVRVVRTGSGASATTSTQVVTLTSGLTTTVAGFSLDAAGNLASDTRLTFAYDAQGRLAQLSARQSDNILAGEAAQISFLHNALGQRVFKSEPRVQNTAPNEAELGADFVAWLRRSFGWLFVQAQANATLGQSFVYAHNSPSPMLLGEYGNGAASGSGRTEYLYLPADANGVPSTGEAGASAALPVPVGLHRANRYWAIHSDHLATPRLMRDDRATPVWQWPYSAFGDNGYSDLSVFPASGKGHVMLT
jgi:YD repeat-containing protein